MLKRIALGLSLLMASPAAAQQVTPSFGLDSSGAMRKLYVRDPTLPGFVPFEILNTTTHSIVTATTPVEAYGAKGDSNGTTGNGTDDTAAIEACVTGGRICALRPGATYRLMTAIDIPSNGGLVGDKTATLYCDPAGINNTSGLFANRYLQTASCIKVEGPSAQPQNAVASVVLKDFKINWGGNSGNRCCQAIDARNTKNMTIDGLEVFNLSASGIRYSSWQGGRITGNYIHDASNDTGGEYSGIEGDNDMLSGVESSGVLISGNRVVNMLMSEAGYLNTLADASLPDGYQPNGIKLINGGHMTVTNNYVESTGQSIDVYIDDSVISDNVLKNGLNFCLSLKHTVKRNVVSGNNLDTCGTGALFVGGDPPPNEAVGNVLIGNRITTVADGTWAAVGWSNPNLFNDNFNTTGVDNACITTSLYTNTTLISNNSCDPGPNGDYMWRASGNQGGGTNRNYWFNNYGSPGRAGGGGRWYNNGEFEQLSTKGDAQVLALAPWIDVASTFATILPAGNLVNVTGTGLINDFIGGVGGQYYIIRFSGAVPLRCRPPGTDGSGGMLTCPLDIPATTAVDDMMMLTVDVPKNAASQVGGVYRVAWYHRANGTVPLVFNANAADGAILLQRTNAGADAIPLYVRNNSAADGTTALMDFASAGQSNVRSVQIGDIDKPTTGAHCFTVRTSLGALPAERTFTCLGTVVGAPTGGTNGDMGAGTLNATGLYVNGVAVNQLPATTTTVAALPTCNGSVEGARRGVTDANAATYNTVAAGGGTNHMPVYCNGTAWVLH
jgi:hypothetical protein